MQYSEYAKYTPTIGEVKPTTSSAEVVSSQSEATTPQAAPLADQQVIGQEERVEYRDQDGNLLDPEEVAQLIAEGVASFSTKYETETKLVDQFGNVIPDEDRSLYEAQEPASEPESVAPEHPDVEGQNPDTKGAVDGSREPASVEVPAQPAQNEAEQSPEAEPPSDAVEATASEEAAAI